jgi:NADH:ubiquinone oxidoreductase subunit 6 (subunit J)
LYAGGLVVLFGLAIGTTGGVSEEKLGNRPSTIVGGILALAILLAGLDVMPAVGQIPLGATPVDVDLARTITERPIAFEGIGLVVLVSVIGSLALLRGRREA